MVTTIHEKSANAIALEVAENAPNIKCIQIRTHEKTRIGLFVFTGEHEMLAFKVAQIINHQTNCTIYIYL